MYTTLISAQELRALMAGVQPLRIFDCSFELMQPHAGREHYLQAHIPGSLYADLDTDLSARHGVPGAHGALTAGGADHPASGGRHPLPNREKFATWLSSVGFANNMQAVVYDRNGANYCGRLWWMLKWAGHEGVAILDGGLQAWEAAGGQTASGEEASHFQSNFELGPECAALVDAGQVADQLGRPAQTLIDARAPARFRGEVEPLDPVAGHIPGALNRPFSQNIGADGKFKSPVELRTEFEALLGGRDPASVVHHCGSGVSAIPNLIGMEIAGLGRSGLYAGSWSDWCSDTARPVVQG
ncbi:MAG: sulfurtransferase [Pseudomonadota bacterium]|uniref:sulfurtransferase n=1 Tax=Polaromonas sp. TaxID=1869339 RepID=UPI0017F33A22|nr:sulfurtransferase [Polaromonas sp.]MBA3595586.1 sulfurtransferase [Polaromonas sp.]MDQ3271837.1 sulfurtransferase [Pseudomonadota bacterium]